MSSSQAGIASAAQGSAYANSSNCQGETGRLRVRGTMEENKRGKTMDNHMFGNLLAGIAGIIGLPTIWLLWKFRREDTVFILLSWGVGLMMLGLLGTAFYFRFVLPA